MSRVQVKKRYSDEFKVINHLGTSYLLEVSQNQFPTFDDLKDKEIIPIKEKCVVKLFKAGINYYLTTGEFVSEIIGAKQVWILTENFEKWRSVGHISSIASCVIAVQEEHDSIFIFKICVNNGISYSCELIKEITQDYLPPENMYDANEMPLGINVNGHHILETFWSLIENQHTTQKFAFYINLLNNDSKFYFQKDDLIGEIINPKFVLTRKGILNMITHEFVCYFKDKNTEFIDEISKYMNVPCERGFCLAIPKDAEYILSYDNFDVKTWKINGNDDAICGFLWDPNTMTKVYPIQQEKPNSRLYLYNNALPHIVIVDENGVSMYYVYYWQENSLKFVISYKKPSIFLCGEEKFIIIKENSGNDLILRLNCRNEFINRVYDYAVEYCVFVNDKDEKEIKPAWSDRTYYCSTYPLLIFVLRSRDSMLYPYIMFYTKSSRRISPVLLSGDKDLSFDLLKYGYIKLCRNTDGKMTTSYCDWKEGRIYGSEKELWNASVNKAESIIEYIKKIGNRYAE